MDYEFVDGQGDIGVIASVTEPFCSSCTRMRVTADGKIVTCLFSDVGHDVKAKLRAGATDADIADFIANIWRNRTDRYSARAFRSAQYFDLRSQEPQENRNDFARRLIESAASTSIYGSRPRRAKLARCSAVRLSIRT